MNKTLDMNKILEDMLNTSLSNCILSQLQEGNLVEDEATVYISYFLLSFIANKFFLDSLNTS